jgi:iron complex transport system substrate-binding protein
VRRLVAGALLLGLAAGPAAAELAITDQTGRTLRLPGPPRRVVSLVPSATEILFAIGAQDRLAGVTDFCDFPPAARARPSVGGMVSPNLETLVALTPDLVLATPSGNRQETFLQLARLGLPVFLLDPGSLEEALDAVARLGALTGEQEAAARLVAGLRGRIRAVARRVAPYPRPRVLYVLWPEPLIVPGRGALVSDLIRAAGGESVTADRSEAYPRYSLEAALARGPEVIVLARHGTRAPAGLGQWERLTRLASGRGARVHAVNGDLVHRYGPRMVDGLEVLSRMIHPAAWPAAAGSPAGRDREPWLSRGTAQGDAAPGAVRP